uniref:CSON013115 protein n=1 Tax=Culicoides sonorensis TaxID=179676 RepID=A0A336MJ67_CULSO
MSDKFKNLCRLCLQQDPEFNIYEDKIGTKITALLSDKMSNKDLDTVFDATKFIKLIKEHGILWNSKLPKFFSSTAAKREAWLKIAKKMYPSENLDIKLESELDEIVNTFCSKWKTLRDGYTRERKRVQLSNGYVPQYIYYDDLLFLGDRQSRAPKRQSGGQSVRNQPKKRFKSHSVFLKNEDEIQIVDEEDYDESVTEPEQEQDSYYETEEHLVPEETEFVPKVDEDKDNLLLALAQRIAKEQTMIEIGSEPCELPSKICRGCRLNLEKLYIFRIRSLDTDLKLRQKIYGIETLKDRISDSISFLKENDSDFNEHDYGEKSIGGRPFGLKTSVNTSEEEYASIEKTVRQALNQNNYYGQFVLKIEDIDANGLRKIRVIKENGANVIMKIRMPDIPNIKKPETTKPDETLKKILAKCENIETNQERMSKSVSRTEKAVHVISTIVQTSKSASSPSNIEFIDFVEQDDPKGDYAPFELPINTISDLWRLNSRITDPEVREAMNLEMLKIEAQPGIKVIGRVVRAVIDKDLLGQLCWSGKVKVEHKYLKTDDRLMLSKMKNLVDYLFEVCKSKEDTTNHVFLQTVMNIIRKARFKVKDNSYTELAEFGEEYLNDDEVTPDYVEEGEIDG